MSLTSKCPSCGHTHIVRPAIGQGAHGAGVIVLEHEQLAHCYEEALRENDVLVNASATARSIITAQQDEIERLRAQVAAIPFEEIVACAWDSINGDCSTGGYPAAVLNWVDRQPHGTSTSTKEAHA